MVVSGPHFNERVGVTFEELVIKEDLTRTVEEDDAAIKQAEEVVKRNYRKSGTESFENPVKRSPSPPIVAKPKKPKMAQGMGEKRRSLSSVSSISSSDLSDFDPAQSATPKKNNKLNEKSSLVSNKNKSPFKKQQQDNKRVEPRGSTRQSPPRRNRTNEGYEKPRSVLPWQRSDYRSRNDNPVAERPKPKIDKQAEFKKLASAIEKDMDRIFKQHEKHPEKHPQYNDEWKKFWNQRYKELQAEGKNPAGHDFKPEWIEYWNKRLKEIHGIEVKNKKEALRKRLGIPEEPAPICFRITGRKKPSQKDEAYDSKLAPMASAPDYDPDVIIIDDKDGTENKNLKRSRSPWEKESGRVSHRSRETESRSRSGDRRTRSRSRSRGRRSHSREREMEWSNRDRFREYSREQLYYRGEYPPEYIKPPRVMRDATRHPVNSPPRSLHQVPPEPEPEPEDDGEINIVSVLRLLTALEEKLGSLGPKVIDLLSQALGMEKSEANSSETLLDNEINCVMFETVKEKLKGQLLAGLVNTAQEKAFKIAIKKIASLIYIAGERKKEKEKKKPKLDPIQVPGIGKVDKGAIAKQIAAALIVQGKTDVTQAELEQLINAVVGMAEASQGSNKPMTTASFLQQLTKPKQPVDKVEQPMAAFRNVFQTPVESASVPLTNSMEGLSDSDLQTLLQNFKDLCTDEQHSLISYLKKLEAREPERVERLRKFVNLEAPSIGTDKDADTFEKSDEEVNGKVSPFASRLAGTNPTSEDNLRNTFNEKPRIIDKVTIDSDEEDYTFEDVFKAANKNIRDKEEKEEQERLLAQSTTVFKNEDFDLSNAKSLIANIMGQFRGKPEAALPAPNLTMPVVVPPPQPPSVPLPAMFPNPNFLDNIPINITNITNALNAAQQIKPNPPSMVQVQPPISNQNMFSLQPRPRLNNANSNLNNFSLQSRSEQNQPYPTRPLFLGSQQQQQHHDSMPRFEPPRQNQIPPLLGNNFKRGDFNRPMHPNKFGQRQEYSDNYDDRW